MKLTTVSAAAPPPGSDTRGQGCHLTKLATQAIEVTATVHTWDTETYDDLGFHESVTNPTRITIPANVSRVMICGACGVSDGTIFTDQETYLQIGGVDINESIDWQFEFNSTIAHEPVTQFTIPWEVSAGNYFEMVSKAGGTQTTVVARTFFSCYVLRN